MMIWPATVLAQCPCSGGGGSGGESSGVSTWLILGAALGMWLLARSIWNEKGMSLMGKMGKIAIVAVLAVAVVGVIVMKKGATSAPPAPPVQSTVTTAGGLPRLVDLGSTTCIPCKMMAPILEELKKEYAGRMQVDFIDVNADGDAARLFAITLIPTQVFLDASGKELWRHEGFISKDDILSKWNELGVNLAGGTPAASQPSGDPA